MTATYTRSDDPDQNPAPVTFDALSSVGVALERAAGKSEAVLSRGPDIMGVKLSPSPEMQGAGWAVLEVDYEDGKTLTFDVDPMGKIEPRKYAYASALVFETDHQLSEDEIEMALAFIGQSFLNCESFDAEVEFATTPRQAKLRTGDYDMQPCDMHLDNMTPARIVP